jgi:hypothetical protein
VLEIVGAHSTTLGASYDPVGVLFAAAISRWASLLDAVMVDFLAAPDYRAAVTDDLRGGQHRNTPARDGLFTTAYFHRPVEFHEELRAAHFDVVGIFGVEGPAPGCWRISTRAGAIRANVPIYFGRRKRSKQNRRCLGSADISSRSRAHIKWRLRADER